MAASAAMIPKPLSSAELVNWAGIYSAKPLEFYEPTSTPELQEIVRSARARGLVVRAVGALHSPNDSAFTNDIIVSLAKLNRVLVLDLERKLVKVEAGITLETLNEVLATHGLALPNLGSISEQTVAGAISTGTHGECLQGLRRI